MPEIVIGVDVGTTEIKSCITHDGVVKASVRSPTPSGKDYWLDTHRYWLDVRDQVIGLSAFVDAHLTLSIVTQAPTICVWSEHEHPYSISYLAEYGDSRKNHRTDRLEKTLRRIEKLRASYRLHEDSMVSGLTGYLVYQATGIHTLDSVTAWEMGIESEADLTLVRTALADAGAHLPEPSPPCHRLRPINAKGRLAHEVLVGTTDSAAIPAIFYPTRCDYYMYLGTWGCVLRTALSFPRSYTADCYLPGQLNTWLVSIEDFATSHFAGSDVLNILLEQTAALVPSGSTIGISGGVLLSNPTEVSDRIAAGLPGRTVVTADFTTVAAGASRLAMRIGS